MLDCVCLPVCRYVTLTSADELPIPLEDSEYRAVHQSICTLMQFTFSVLRRLTVVPELDFAGFLLAVNHPSISRTVAEILRDATVALPQSMAIAMQGPLGFGYSTIRADPGPLSLLRADTETSGAETACELLANLAVDSELAAQSFIRAAIPSRLVYLVASRVHAAEMATEAIPDGEDASALTEASLRIVAEALAALSAIAAIDGVEETLVDTASAGFVASAMPSLSDALFAVLSSPVCGLTAPVPLPLAEAAAKIFANVTAVDPIDSAPAPALRRLLAAQLDAKLAGLVNAAPAEVRAAAREAIEGEMAGDDPKEIHGGQVALVIGQQVGLALASLLPGKALDVINA
jgi:hypothetical protein